jgi:hypothetical protein
MAIIQRKIKLVGPLGESEITALFDSGASVSCIRPDVAATLEHAIAIQPPWRISTAKEGAELEVAERVSLDFYINGYRFMTDFYIVPGLTEEAIIGATTMQQWRFKLDFEHEEVIIDPRVTRMRL